MISTDIYASAEGGGGEKVYSNAYLRLFLALFVCVRLLKVEGEEWSRSSHLIRSSITIVLFLDHCVMRLSC